MSTYAVPTAAAAVRAITACSVLIVLGGVPVPSTAERDVVGRLCGWPVPMFAFTKCNCWLLLVELASYIKSVRWISPVSREIDLPMWRALVLVLAAACSSCSALQLGSAARCASRARVAMAGGPAPAVPKTRTRQVTRTAKPQVGKPQQKQKVQNAKPAMKKEMEEEPMWKVVMLGDEEYECDPVCDVLQTVIPDIENFKQAKEKYDEAESTGKSMLIVVPKEHAEAYVEQLIRAEPMVYAEIEEE